MKEGWTYKKLGEVCEIFGRIGFRGYTKADLVDSPNDGAITLSPSNIVNGEMDYSKCSYITWAKYEESPEIMIYPGDILLVKTASVGKTALVRDLPHKATINPQFVVFKNIETNHDYLSYYMKSEKAQKYIWSIAKGAAAQTVSQKNLAEMQVPVPTKAEQQRIVSRLDSAFAHIDELKANAEKQLSEARALFQKALTKAMEPKEGWEGKKLGELGELKNGMNFAHNEKGYDMFLLGVGDFGNRFSIDNVEQLSMISLNQKPSEDYMLIDGDIVFVRSNGNKQLVGRSVIVYPNETPVTFSGFCIRFRRNTSIINERFLVSFLKSEGTRKKLFGNGANPRTWIPCKGEDQCMDRIGTECSFLNIELDHVIMERSYDTELRVSMHNLIGLAAHEKMYDLLQKYDK